MTCWRASLPGETSCWSSTVPPTTVAVTLPFPTTSRCCIFRPIRRNSIRRKISGMKSAKKSSRTTRLNPWMPCALSSGRQSSISSAIPNCSALSPPSPISPTHSDVETVLEVIELARNEIANNHISVRTQLAETLPAIQGDRVQLQQVILNLLINAIEAMSGMSEGPRELLISTTKTDSEGVLVAVRDSGPGLAPERVDRLFESFYTTKPGGLGMGLSICRSIIEAHH